MNYSVAKFRIWRPRVVPRPHLLRSWLCVKKGYVCTFAVKHVYVAYLPTSVSMSMFDARNTEDHLLSARVAFYFIKIVTDCYISHALVINYSVATSRNFPRKFSEFFWGIYMWGLRAKWRFVVAGSCGFPQRHTNDTYITSVRIIG